MEHDTNKNEMEMLQDRIRKIGEDFKALPEERQKAIAKQIGEAMQGEIMVAGAQLLEQLKESGTAFAKSLAETLERTIGESK